ncbi:hypothetical protein GIB67_017712 [Kingdonia uniflora]|uniref:Uncharacterized protein n=1 Tax=Kingdonia uniflora TaxID=39325 RepID=A0A7J7NB93_9MAGN|nr:hypothetical protein GIB67_017712 [Kingdonia uniflora]
MNRYKKEVEHPIQNRLGGELVCALLIHIQKLKLDTKTAMLELNQILKANEINFVMLATLPAFFLSLILLMFVRTWFKGDKRAQGRGSLDRLYRAVKRHAKATGEWPSLRHDIINLGKPGLQTAHKLIATSRIQHFYDFLHPLSDQH